MNGQQTPALYEEAVALLVSLQQYADGKYQNGAVYRDALKPWLDDFLVRTVTDDSPPSLQRQMAIALSRLVSAIEAVMPSTLNPKYAMHELADGLAEARSVLGDFRSSLTAAEGIAIDANAGVYWRGVYDGVTHPRVQPDDDDPMPPPPPGPGE